MGHHTIQCTCTLHKGLQLTNLPFRTLIDRGTKEFLKWFSLYMGTLKGLPEGRSWYSGWRTWVRSEIIFLACFMIVLSKTACSVRYWLTPMIFMAFCVSLVIWAFTCTLRLPQQAEMPYHRMLSTTLSALCPNCQSVLSLCFTYRHSGLDFDFLSGFWFSFCAVYVVCLLTVCLFWPCLWFLFWICLLNFIIKLLNCTSIQTQTLHNIILHLYHGCSSREGTVYCHDHHAGVRLNTILRIFVDGHPGFLQWCWGSSEWILLWCRLYYRILMEPKPKGSKWVRFMMSQLTGPAHLASGPSTWLPWNTLA